MILAKQKGMRGQGDNAKGFHEWQFQSCDRMEGSQVFASCRESKEVSCEACKTA